MASPAKHMTVVRYGLDDMYCMSAAVALSVISAVEDSSTHQITTPRIQGTHPKIIR
jgi:hypothetical protein